MSHAMESVSAPVCTLTMEEELLLSQDLVDLPIYSPTHLDASKTAAWQSFLNRDELLAAWSTPEDSPYGTFAKTKTMDCIEFLAGRIRPRFTPEDEKCCTEIVKLAENPLFDEHTALILNSGGSHSVAMAAELAKLTGHQPVIMFNTVPLSHGSNQQAYQESAVLLYYAQQMKDLKDAKAISPTSAPIFVLDCHRNDTPFNNQTDNGYIYSGSDFPTAGELREAGIHRVIYLDEGDQLGEFNDERQTRATAQKDIKPTLDDWAQDEIEILYTGILPSTPGKYGNERLDFSTMMGYKYP